MTTTMPIALDTIQLLAAGAALLCLIAAAVEDGWRYRISNIVVIGVAACFAVYAAAEASWPFLAWSLAAGVAALAVASVPFAFGVFGGGDTKLIAVMALWTQFAGLPRFVVVMSAFGGLLGVVWLVRRRLGKGAAEPTQAAGEGAATAETSAAAGAAPEDTAAEPTAAPYSHLPYGIAIALAGIDYFLFAPASPLAAWLPY